jgi:hypothetical protein
VFVLALLEMMVLDEVRQEGKSYTLTWSVYTDHRTPSPEHGPGPNSLWFLVFPLAWVFFVFSSFLLVFCGFSFGFFFPFLFSFSVFIFYRFIFLFKNNLENFQILKMVRFEKYSYWKVEQISSFERISKFEQISSFERILEI